jgi:hypothetical protein
MADFFVEVLTSDPERPKVMIRLGNDMTTASDVKKYKSLQELKEALMRLGVPVDEVKDKLKDRVQEDPLAGEPACFFARNISEELAKDFGWEGNP